MGDHPGPPGGRRGNEARPETTRDRSPARNAGYGFGRLLNGFAGYGLTSYGARATRRRAGLPATAGQPEPDRSDALQRRRALPNDALKLTAPLGAARRRMEAAPRARPSASTGAAA